MTYKNTPLYFIVRYFLSLAFVLVVSLSAQEPLEGWFVPFACGYQPDVSGFNAKFAALGLPQANTRHYGWGIELRSLVGRNFLVGPMFFRTWDDAQNESLHLRTDATGILGEIGLRLPFFKFLTVVPMLGLGGVQPHFHIREKSGDVPFDSLLRRGVTVTLSPGMRLSGLVALEVNLLLSTKAGRYGLALRGGYLYSPFSLNWRLGNGARLVNAPGTSIRGPWFSVGITLIPPPEVTTIE